MPSNINVAFNDDDFEKLKRAKSDWNSWEQQILEWAPIEDDPECNGFEPPCGEAGTHRYGQRAESKETVGAVVDVPNSVDVCTHQWQRLCVIE